MDRSRRSHPAREAQSLHLTPGWDNLTGVGSPDGPGYVFALGGRGR